MDTIRNYVDMMFKDLPKTKEVIDMKMNILDSMEDKYNELIAEGKSDNEAIGTVISQFGNIDELKEELGIKSATSNAEPTMEQTLPFVSDDEVMQYLNFKSQFSFMIAIGVSLCIVSVIPPTFDNMGDLGTMIMFCIIAIAVAIFIIAGMKNTDFDQLEKKRFQTQLSLKTQIENEYQRFKPRYSTAIAIGVGLCIISPVLYMLVENTFDFPPFIAMSRFYENDLVDGFASAALFLSVAVAVFLFVSYGIRKGAYELILQNEKKHEEIKNEEQEEQLYNIIMPLAGIAYLVMGFCFGWWHPGWLIFPIAAILVQAIKYSRVK